MRSGGPLTGMTDLMPQNLTAYTTAPASADPLTGAGTMTRTQILLQPWPCSLQPVRRIPDATLMNLSGTEGTKQAWRCYTRWFDAAGVSEVRVDGRFYTLLKVLNVAGADQVIELQLGAPEERT